MSDDTPDTNFKVIDTRSPETRARVAGDHIGDANEMVGEALKLCPHCGGKPGIVYLGETDFGWVQCNECPGRGADAKIPEAISLWNRRAPEPMTSVVRWVRYDGTPETLPEEEVAFFLVCNGLLLRQSYSFHPWAGQYEVMGDIMPIPRNLAVGDLWAYLPQPPEGAE